MSKREIPNEYILGLPIETSAGTLSQIRVYEYNKYFPDLSLMAMEKTYIIYSYASANKNGELDELVDELTNLTMYEIVKGLPDFKEAYDRLFVRCLGEESLSLISADNFNEIRSRILDSNCISTEEAMISLDKSDPKNYLNFEIQKAVERSKRVKNQGNDDAAQFDDIVSSIVVFSGIDYSVIANWTLYQMYMAFSRISQFKNYDTTTLFATVSGEVNIENWSKHINLFAKENHALDKNNFDKNYGGVFS